MLSGVDSSGGVQQQHMLPQQQNGSMLNNP